MNHDALQANIRELLVLLGEDPDRPGLAGTPERVARWWTEFIDYDPGNTDTTFESIQTDQLVAVTGVRVWSLCEHHLLPFHADLTIGYLAKDHVVGLSKMARLAHKHAHRLQLQERLVHGIAEDMQHLVQHDNVAVYGEGEHLCMTMRGIRSPGIMKSSAMFGAFRDEPAARAEFMELTHNTM